MSNSWNYIHVVTSYITYIVIIAYFGAQYMQIDIEYLLFNQNRQTIQLAQMVMIILGVVSIVAWEMSDFAKQLKNKTN